MRAFLLCVLIACSSKTSAPAPAPAPPKALEPATNVSSLAARLQYEAAHRPAAAISAERVFDALDRAGLPVAQRTQYAGIVMKASYCAGGRADDGLVVAICEYQTHDAALAGKDFMDQTFPLATARREVRGSTVMTAIGGRRDRALTAFETL
jgi:hypothetical protein